jgi:hypothetical protein
MHPRTIFVNGQRLIFIMKRLVEDSGRPIAVLFSRGKASIHTRVLARIDECLSYDKPRSRARITSIALVPSIV